MGWRVPEPDLDEDWWPSWQDPAPDDLPGPPRQPATPDESLLRPLARVVEALARLDARIGAASADIAEGLRRRIALHESAGWLAHHGTWIHPTDLALREAGLTGSYTAAVLGKRVPSALPATLAAGQGREEPPEDAAVSQALQLGRLWRRLGELRTWSPLADPDTLRETLDQLGHCHGTEIEAWRDRFADQRDTELPALIRVGQAAQAWTLIDGQGRTDRLSTAGLFLGACIWRQQRPAPALPLPVWSATPQLLNKLALRGAPAWLLGFLGCVADAAQRAGQELTRLQAVEAKAMRLQRTSRSHLPKAARLALRLPVLTARTLAEQQDISHQAALGLLAQLVVNGLIREATGRAAWRAFVVG
jgi:hypothetical protein